MDSQAQTQQLPFHQLTDAELAAAGVAPSACNQLMN